MKKSAKSTHFSATIVSPETVAHIGQLASLQISTAEQQSFAQAFTETLEEVNNIFAVESEGIEPTHHVTGLVNVWRDDVVDKNRLFTQKEALSQAEHTFQGMVVVDRVLEGDTA